MKSRVKYLAGLALFVAVSVQAQSKPPAPLSGSEMTTRVGELKAQIDKDAQSMRHLQAVARKEKDVIKLSCVNDTLVQLKAEQNLFDESERIFTGEVGDDATSARDDFEAMTSSASKIADLRAAAEACVGVPELYKQESATTVEAPELDDPIMPTQDPFDPGLEPPAHASPFI
jgi:hypothetical protein